MQDLQEDLQEDLQKDLQDLQEAGCKTFVKRIQFLNDVITMNLAPDYPGWLYVGDVLLTMFAASVDYRMISYRTIITSSSYSCGSY